MFMNKNQRIKELEGQVQSGYLREEMSRNLVIKLRCDFQTSLKYFKDLYENARAQVHTLSIRLDQALQENELLRAHIIHSAQIEPINVTIDIKPATTVTAGDVTLQELAELVIDGTPIQRVALSPIEINMYKGEKSNG